MNPSQLENDIARKETWEKAEGHLIKLLTDMESGLNNYERRHDGFIVTLDGIPKPFLIPYKPGGRPQAPPPAPETPPEGLESFQEDQPEPAPPPKPKVITVPRPTPKTAPNEMMMSLAGLTMRYDKHVRQCIAFVLSRHVEESSLDQAVDEALAGWMEYLKGRMPK